MSVSPCDPPPRPSPQADDALAPHSNLGTQYGTMDSNSSLRVTYHRGHTVNASPQGERSNVSGVLLEHESSEDSEQQL